MLVLPQNYVSSNPSKGDFYRCFFYILFFYVLILSFALEHFFFIFFYLFIIFSPLSLSLSLSLLIFFLFLSFIKCHNNKFQSSSLDEFPAIMFLWPQKQDFFLQIALILSDTLFLLL